MIDECCVYWIRLPEHTDIFTQGYVGISFDFAYRLSQHLYSSQNPKYYRNYRTAFRQALGSGNYVASKILVGTRRYCMEVEEKLRPQWRIGWNLAKGGSGGYGKHGLSGTRELSTYQNILHKAKLAGDYVCEEWTCENGAVNFYNFYNSLPKEGELFLEDRSKGYSPTNLKKMSRSEICRRANAKHDLGDGVLRSVEELSEIYGIKANTISTNLSRGFTLRQSLGLEDKPPVFKEWSYEKEMAVYYLWNTPLTHSKIGSLVGLDKSTLRRLLKDYKLPAWLFSHCEVVDRFRPIARRILRTRSFEDFDTILDIEDAYISGKAINAISKEFNVSHGAIELLIKELENADYY